MLKTWLTTITRVLKYTDERGITRALPIADINGMTVIINDGVPVSASPKTYGKTSDEDIVAGKTYYTRTGDDPDYVYTAVADPKKANLSSYYEVTAYNPNEYTTFILGNGAIKFEEDQ